MITQINNIPKELKKLKQWCVYKIVSPKKDGQHKGKIPINPVTSKGANSTDPNTWVDFRTAVKFADNYDGLGFFFNDDYIGIDIDDIAEEIEAFKQNSANTSNLINWLNSLINHSYLELSQSGKGIHAIVKGKYDLNNNRRNNFEIYNHGRFFALTGNILNNQKSIKEANKKNLRELYTSTVEKKKNNTPVETRNSIPYGNNLSTDEIITKMFASDSGVKIKHLMDGEYDYNSQSEADIALCNYLAFWTNKDAAKMDTIFRQSKLMRDKWDRKDGATTYGQRTINKAILDTQNSYSTSGDATNTNINFEWNKKNKLPRWIYFSDKKKEKKKVNVPLLGEEILNNYIFLISENKDKEAFYEYQPATGIYIERPKNYIKTVVHEYLVQYRVWKQSIELQTYQFILGGLKRELFINTFGKNPKMIFNFKNGVFDWSTMKLRKHSPNDYFTTSANYDLDMTNSNKAPETNKYFELVFGENAKTMKEFVGYCFYPSYEPIQAIIILLGSGGDGKSTFARYLTNLVDKSNTSNISLKDLASNKENNFKLSELYHKSLNISAELKDTTNNLNTAIIKQLSGGDNNNASVKGKDDLNFPNYAKLLIHTNELVTFRDTSKGWRRRIFVINFHSIPNFEQAINWQNIKEEYGAFVYQCIQLANEAIKRKDLTTTNSILKNRSEWIKSNDPLQSFIDECCYKGTKETVNKKDLINAYRNWCFENGYNPLGSQKLKSKLKEKHIYEHDSNFQIADSTKREHIYYFEGISLNNNANAESKYNPVVSHTKLKGKA